MMTTSETHEKFLTYLQAAANALRTTPNHVLGSMATALASEVTSDEDGGGACGALSALAKLAYRSPVPVAQPVLDLLGRERPDEWYLARVALWRDPASLGVEVIEASSGKAWAVLSTVVPDAGRFVIGRGHSKEDALDDAAELLAESGWRPGRTARECMEAKQEPEFAFRGGEMTARHPLTKVLFESLGQCLGGAQNYVEISGTGPDGPLVVRIERCGKLTPHTARLQAEECARGLAAKLAELGHPTDIPASFAPPAPAPLPPADQPWLRIKYGESPAHLECLGCGKRQDLPEKVAGSLLTTMIEGFRTVHGGCDVAYEIRKDGFL